MCDVMHWKRLQIFVTCGDDLSFTQWQESYSSSRYIYSSIKWCYFSKAKPYKCIWCCRGGTVRPHEWSSRSLMISCRYAPKKLGMYFPVARIKCDTWENFMWPGICAQPAHAMFCFSCSSWDHHLRCFLATLPMVYPCLAASLGGSNRAAHHRPTRLSLFGGPVD